MENFFIIVAIIIFFIIWTFMEQKQFIVKKYEVNHNELPTSFHNTKFVLLADLHNHTFGNENERLIRRIQKLQPEFIIVAGDMIDKHKPCYPSNAYILLEKLAKEYQIYYAYGNHEQRIEGLQIDNDLEQGIEGSSSGQNPDQIKLQHEIGSTWVKFKEKLSKLGVIFLDNESIMLSKNKERIKITGLSIGQEYFQRTGYPDMNLDYLNSMLGKKQSNLYHILVAHNPVHFKQYAAWGAELTISGHLHGGMARIPGIGGIISPQVKFFPKYSGGVYSENHKVMVVSRGLGSHSMMPRYFNVPEVVEITLKRSNINS